MITPVSVWKERDGTWDRNETPYVYNTVNSLKFYIAPL